MITKKIRELAKELHKKEHIFVSKKIEKDHKLEDYYYLMASYIFQTLFDRIENSNVEIFNKIVDLERRFNDLSKSMKEVSKQQKYLWQTLEELKKEKEVGE